MATFINTATLSYNNKVTNSNVVTGEILEVLSATKNVVDGTYGAGDTLTYVISIVNSGTAPVTNVTVTDNLGEYTSDGGAQAVPLDYVPGTVRLYVDGVPAAAPAVGNSNPLTFTGITVPAEGNVIILYEARANSFAPLDEGGTITNEAVVSGGNIALPITVSAQAQAESEPDLTISKSVSPETVVEDGQITYTFVIQNSGNLAADAEDNVVVSDLFDPILSNITVTLDGIDVPVTDYTYNSATGEFETTPGAITVPAATYSVDEEGRWVVTPGVTVLKISGTV